MAVIVGDPTAGETRSLASAARRALAPEDAVVVVAPGASAPAGLDPAWITGRGLVDGRPAAYLCRGTTCSLPVREPGALEALARSSP
jgi:uncharacterized protein YyaL (SSP411 family)